MYLECCEGVLDQDWKVDKPVSFHRFREKLARQQLQYDPRERKYAGDEFYWVATQQPTRYRSPPRSSKTSSSASCSSVDSNTSSSVTSEQLKLADTRLCGDLSKFIEVKYRIQRSSPGSPPARLVNGIEAFTSSHCMRCKRLGIVYISKFEFEIVCMQAWCTKNTSFSAKRYLHHDCQLHLPISTHTL